MSLNHYLVSRKSNRIVGFFTIRKSDSWKLAEHETDVTEVASSKPHWGQFLMKFILFCVTLDLSDNLTEMLIVKKVLKSLNSVPTLQRISLLFEF